MSLTDDREDVVAAARGLVPTLRERATETEARRSLPDETVQDLKDARIFKIMQPAKYGGLELGFDVLSEVAHQLGTGCGSAAWVTVVLNGGWFLASFPEQAAEDVWGDDPDALVGGVLAPTTQVSRADGGWRLSGRWPYSSGVDHCRWNIVGGFDLRPDAPPDIRLFLLPASDYTVDDTWFTLGLRGTGSKTTVVDNAFVPDHRTLSLGLLREGRGPGTEVFTSAFYRVPFGVFFPLAIASPVLGIAEAALEYWKQGALRRMLPGGEAVAKQPSTQLVWAESSAEVDSARLLVQRDIALATQLAHDRVTPPPERRATAWRDGAYAVLLCARATQRLFSNAGGQVLSEQDPLQRCWRDIYTAQSHISMRWNDAGERFGKLEFGLGPGNPFFY